MCGTFIFQGGGLEELGGEGGGVTLVNFWVAVEMFDFDIFGDLKFCQYFLSNEILARLFWSLHYHIESIGKDMGVCWVCFWPMGNVLGV